MAAATTEDLAYLNTSGGKRLTRCSNLRNASTAKAAIQAITEAESRCGSRLSCSDDESDDGGVHRVKLVIRKNELKQMVASLGWVKLGANSHRFTSAGLEQFFNALRTKQLKKAELENNGRRSGRWEPALHSIPEEF